MRGRAALALCACLLVAGCIGTVEAGTAQEHRDTAAEEAESFAGPDADLVSITAFESKGPDPGQPTNESQPLVGVEGAFDDDELGDGDAPAWIYGYQTADTTYNIVVAANGTVIARQTQDDVYEDAVPVGEWSVSSDEAAEIVAENNESWETDRDGFGFYTLARGDDAGDPIWTLGQFREDASLIARVHADTGQFLGTQSLGFGLEGGFDFGPVFGDEDDEPEDEPVPQEGGTFSDTVTAAEDTNEHAFQIGHEDHPRLGVQLRTEGPTSGTVEVTVEGPDGELGSFESEPGTGTQSREASWEDPAAGDYTITVELTDGVERDYTLHWCADGEADPEDEEAREACEAMVFEDQESRLAPGPGLG